MREELEVKPDNILIAMQNTRHCSLLEKHSDLLTWSHFPFKNF